ncbi:2093_t:CDS:2 [Funneliformis geosporum]|nr:2093_t:CDS:2 [Funneliformis geosporum]
MSLHYNPDDTGIKIAPDVAVRPDIAFVSRPSITTVIPRPSSDIDENPHARIVCDLRQKCLTWMQDRAVVSIKI